SRLNCCCDCQRQISARHDNEGVAASQFQNGFFDLLTCLTCDLPAGALAASQSDCSDSRILDQWLYPIAFDQQRLKDTGGKTGSPENVLDRHGALRNVGGMLQESDIACHQRRRRKPEHLPEWKVPRHDCQNRAQRVIAYEGPSCSGLDELIREP